jgi:hypothetical protein
MHERPQRLHLIGAGASVPYGLPTLKTLLWDLCQELEAEEKEILVDAVYQYCGVALRKPEDSPDFEQFLARLDAGSLHFLGDDEPSAASGLPARAKAVALRGLREFIHSRCQAASEQIGPYDDLLGSLKKGDAIICFNWDVMLEMAIRRAGREYTYLKSEAGGDPVLLLKPHGCICWFALLDRELLMIDRGANFDVFGGDLTYYMLYLKDPLGPRDMGTSNTFAKLALSPLAAMVLPNPPVSLSVGGPTHDGFVDNGHSRAMRSIWSTFRALARSAVELVVVGYSLPGTDAATIEVLKEFGTLTKRDQVKPRLVIVDKDRQVVERYRRMVCPDAKLICDDFAKFDPGMLQEEL